MLPALIAGCWMMVASMTPSCCSPDGAPPQDPWVKARRAMVADQVAARGVSDPRVLDAMRAVPRHEFVPGPLREDAYWDSPLSIGYGQTISQPYIVALMTELARPAPGDRALEVGTGSGYQAAVLSRLVARVFSIELLEPLARSAAATLQRLGCANVTVRQGDGYLGWPEEAPFDIILVTAAPEEVPQALVDQLKPGGRLVVPVGPVHDVQDLRLLVKDESGRVLSRSVIPVRFVPLVKRRGS
ncbi:MAG TPA: protein-L-isoaspartate(D-aspartate) O-methyltransferase [Vicinamibacterales bacterium]|nr:protein-L-isoaspartate(D-aspartate) O-methyltransferase [Vicinamibacterales bacterium]HPW19892.1 protein-L-isoaspartate(D-aspartate) O-methyltransferase [Vicinamibacterales bacterium]